MIRWINEADVILENTSDGTLHAYFFGWDVIGVASCYNIRPSDPIHSTVEYSDEESFREEIDDMMTVNHYKCIRGAKHLIKEKGGEHGL